VPTVNPEIVVGRQDDGISKRFGHANEASIGEAHWNVGILLDELHDWLDVCGKFEGDGESAPAKQGTEIGCAAASKKVEGLG